MIHSELPKSNAGGYRTSRKKYVSIITPDRLLINERALLGLLIVVGAAAVLITWAVRKD
jgi:hypothetical protein